MFNINYSLTLLVALAASVSSHVIMIEPHPYNLDTEPLCQTWPLSTELPFPCQGRTQHAEHVTKVTAGTAQTVKFWGSAVHGGGSCQFAICHGDAPSNDVSDWRTIYSMVGGCPAEAVGNIPTTAKDPHGREHGPECGNDVDKECSREFQIPIPKQMKNGPAIFAWTWFNKIGNREMYMVCAPIEVIGGTEDSDFIESLPPLFLANIPGECTTGASGSFINFPEPGDFGKVYEPATPNSHGTCAEGVEPDFKEPSGGDSAPVKPTASAPSLPASTVPSADKTSEVPISNPPSAAPAVTSASTIITSVTAPAEQTNTAAPSSTADPAPPAESGRPDWAIDMEPCPKEQSGQLICLAPEVFGICNQGWTVPQPVAPGTICTDGKITMPLA